LTFAVPQSTSRDLPLRQHVVKFPAATRFDTLWAIYGRWAVLSRGHLNVGYAQVPGIQVQT